VGSAGVAIDVIGTVEKGSGAELHIDGVANDFSPRFRESAYTPIKKAIGQDAHRDVSEMQSRIDKAACLAIAKKGQFVEKIRRI
jgi:hydrogenase expression/formation protein